MSASLLILGFSLILFLYWFRYTCLLILSAKGTKDYTTRMSQANGLELVRVQAALKLSPSAAELPALKAALDHDYHLLTGILRHSARFQISGFSVEQRMLTVNYRVMGMWFLFTHRLPNAESHSRKTVEELADIVTHFANAMGERTLARRPRLANSR